MRRATWSSTCRWWALLVAIAVGKLFGYEGTVIVVANGGPGFCTTSPAVFDAFRAGNNDDGTGMTPLCVKVNDFTADYLENGQAEMFTSNIAYQAGDDSPATPGARSSSRSTTRCGSRATASTCRDTATRPRSR